MAKTTELMKLRNKADKLWLQVIHQGTCCEICGDTNRPEAHHIIGRELAISRHDPLNGVLLCAKHHKWDKYLSAHGAPIAFAEWLRIQRPSQYYYALEQKKQPVGARSNKVIYREAIANLEQILESQ